MIFRSFILLFNLTLLSLSHAAYSAINTEQIRSSVNGYLKNHVAELQNNYGGNIRIDYTISRLDPRLKMADCPVALKAVIKSQKHIGRTNVKVSCPEATPWSLYVPVEINLYREVVTALIPVAKGFHLTQAELGMQEINVSRLNGSYFTELKQVIGMQAKRPLKADKPVLSTFLQQPLLIKKGETVQITAASKSLTVKMPGVALMNGHKGQQITVRNSQSNKKVEARVTAVGQVKVAM